MMITIHGFPAKTKYQDVKILVKQECNINDFILDNLVSEPDGSKKVRIGLTDNSEGYRLMKCLDGYRMPGNFVLKAVPVGKPALTQTPQSGFDSRPGYQNQARNDYSAPARNDYMNQPNDYNNQGFHGPSGLQGPGGSHGPRPSHGGPTSSMDMNRPSPWAGNNASNQWNPNPGMGQVPQSSFNYNSQQNMNPSFGQQNQGPPRSDMRPFNQGRAPPEQNFGFTPKNVPEAPRSRHNLRSIETEDTATTHPPIRDRYPQSQAYQQDKPDNFQGPTQYNIKNPGGLTSSHSAGASGQTSQYPSQATPSPWQSQAQPAKPKFSKPSPTSYDKQYDDRKYIQPDARNPKSQPIRSETQDKPYKDYDKRRAFSPRRSSPGRRLSVERRISPSGSRISPTGRRDSPTGRRVSPSGRRVSPTGRRVSPSGRRVSPTGRRVSPSGRRVSPTGRRVSPSGRRVSPPGRRVSPSGRRVSPSGRRVSPSGRRISPPGPHVRKFSPPGKRVSPDRRVQGHPSAHRDSPHKRASPQRRLVSPPRRSPNRRPSPGRRGSPPRQGRYSPDRLHPDKLDKYGQDKLKSVRPAYEPSSHASNQAMYSGGYRPDTNENAHYPMGMRQGEQRNLPWQRDRDEATSTMKKQDDGRRDITRIQMGRDIRISDSVPEAKLNPMDQRKSRSPIRRERSPLRDRFKRNSPSSRSSRSPRRSWALEKRRTPEIRDAPPPPSWPGQNVRDSDYPRSGRPTFPERDQGDIGKHVPVWERPIEKGEELRSRRPDINERRPFIDDKVRPAKDLSVREPVPQPSHIERFPQREPKFSPRDDFDTERRNNYRRRDTSADRKPQPHREDYDSARRPREHEERPHLDDYHRGRQPSPRHDIRKEEPINPGIDKDFEDIYKRALLFKKKAEELRKLGSKRRDDFMAEERSRSQHSDREREENSRSQRYEDHHRYRDEEPLRPREREERSDRPRDDHSRDDRPRHDPRADNAPHRSDYRSREEYPQHINRFTASPSTRIKREKAIEEICNKIIDRHENYRQMQGEQRARVMEELQLAVARIVYDMFGDNDVSFIEIIIKYQAKYSMKEEEKILQEVMASLPISFRTFKRQAPELSEVPAKIRRSQSPKLKPEKNTFASPKKQRPMQTVLKRKQFQKLDQPAKLDPKVSLSEAKLAKGPIKSSAVSETNSYVSSRKPETKKQEVNKPVAPPVEQLQGGHYELNARMTKMVETELRDIMIKVWQELPDNPTDEAESLVVDKLRNKAGDDLRNVLGLNVTKRLLNVHNPLYVKVQFSGKPEKVHLAEFLKKYNFNAFKRIESTVNMFAAQVKNISDFDNICSAKDVRCGEIKVNVQPIYRFTKCPTNLITSFVDSDDEVSNKTETSERVDKIEEKTEKIKTPEKVETKQNENVAAKPKAVASKTENVANAEKVACLPKVANKTVDNKPVLDKAAANKPAVEKPVNKPAAEKPVNKPAAVVNKTPISKLAAENKNTTNKPAVKKPDNPAVENKTVANKTAVTKTAIENKAVVNKTAVTKLAVVNKTVVNKATVENKSVVNKPATESKTVVNRPAVVTKSAVNQPITEKKTADYKPSVENKEVKKPPINAKNNETAKKPAPSPVKTQVKNANKTGTQTKDTVEKKTTTVESDYDELDDNDILALMSEGIVVDECSGSDDE